MGNVDTQFMKMCKLVLNFGRKRQSCLSNNYNCVQMYFLMLLKPPKECKVMYDQGFLKCYFKNIFINLLGFPGGASGKEPACQCRYLALLDLGCSMRDLQSWLVHVAYEHLVGANGIQFPDQEQNLGRLHWELRVLATGPPEKSPKTLFKSMLK